MSAVWRASRGAVRRRRLQTIAIGLVVLVSAIAITLALSMLSAMSAPFEKTFAAQRGAHLVTSFGTGVPADRLAAPPAQVTDHAGPFAQAVVQVHSGADGETQSRSLNLVGRADPSGPVDNVELWDGRWASAPGEVVLDIPPDFGSDPATMVGRELTVTDGPTLTVVGHAYSVSRTADGWVTPAQAADLRPNSLQMLYRFADADDRVAIDRTVQALSDGLPAGALVARSDWLGVRDAVAAGPGAFVPFIAAFGLLGLVVATMIIGNVVSGAVVSGYRHIGILKSIGFTPRQVVGVYLGMVTVPGVAGSLLGVGLGYLLAESLLPQAFSGLGFGGAVGTPLWVLVTVLTGVPMIVLLSALVPASRAFRISAAEAITAGVAPRSSQGRGIQRWLSGTALPRPLSLGLGLPFGRPARSVLTLAAVVLGVLAMTFATGLTTTVTRYSERTDVNNASPVAMRTGNPQFNEVVARLDSNQIERLLRTLPSTDRVTASLSVPVSMGGQAQSVPASFLRGDYTSSGLADLIVRGRWLTGPDQVVAPSALLHQYDLTVGDTLTLAMGDRNRTVTVVGETLTGTASGATFLTGWSTLEELSPGYQPAAAEMLYELRPKPGIDVTAYVREVKAAAPGLYAWDNRGTNSFTSTVRSLSVILSVMLGVVAALGVLNTVLLTVRERRRDLAMLKCIGMMPGQVVVMMVISMTTLGLVGGLLGVLLGLAAHRLVVPLTASAANIALPDFLLHVWSSAHILSFVAGGVVLAAIGALIPAVSAARMRIAEALHNE